MLEINYVSFVTDFVTLSPISFYHTNTHSDENVSALGHEAEEAQRGSTSSS